MSEKRNIDQFSDYKIVRLQKGELIASFRNKYALMKPNGGLIRESALNETSLKQRIKNLEQQDLKCSLSEAALKEIQIRKNPPQNKKTR